MAIIRFNDEAHEYSHTAFQSPNHVLSGLKYFDQLHKARVGVAIHQ